MLRRVQTISHVGNYLETRAGNVSFGHVTVIYGDNRNGKSTLCDILRSLSLNDPSLITDRKSIVSSKQPNEIQQKIELKFDGQKNSVIFANNKWESLPPECSKLYVFDHSFIHRNVMTGTAYTRENSDSISSFILGENAERFKLLEESNKQLRDDNKKLSELKSQLSRHDISDVDRFAASPLPSDTIEVINSKLTAIESLEKDLSIQASNIDQITLRPNLEFIINHKDIKRDLDSINKCLSSSIESVHEESKAFVKAHKQHIKHPQSFDGWAIKGMQYLKDKCPFCGQGLDPNAQSLIDSYKTAFDNSFQRFMTETKANIMQLQKVSLIDSRIDYIQEQHKRNIMILGSYIEKEVKEELADPILTLADSLESIQQCDLDLHNTYISYSERINNSLNEKRDSPYQPFTPIDFTALLDKLSVLNNSINQYNLIIGEINQLLIDFKKSQDSQSILKQKDSLYKKKSILRMYKKRIELNDCCVNFLDLKSKVKKNQASYEEAKTKLESNQEIFLETYFNRINTIFRQIGSSGFEISRKINRGGIKTVYDLEVTFNGKKISRHKFNSLFSESDRRALALSIFLSKIELLPDEDKKKAILVLDDPVTSFDNERISSILHLLNTLKSSVKQMIITTHYRGMASQTIKQFKDVVAIKIIQKNDGSHLEQATKSEMKETAHDKAYSEIMSFIERKTQDNKIKMLRPFLEEEVKIRYRHPLKTLNLMENCSFGKQITALKDAGYITPKVAESLESFKDQLNIPSHELTLNSIEDCRSHAENMMNFIYTEL